MSGASVNLRTGAAAELSAVPPEEDARFIPHDCAQESGRVVKWHVAEGEAVASGDLLCDVSTSSLYEGEGDPREVNDGSGGRLTRPTQRSEGPLRGGREC